MAGCYGHASVDMQLMKARVKLKRILKKIVVLVEGVVEG